MTAHLWIAGLSFLCAMTCCGIANFIAARILSQVNGRLAPGQRFSPYWWYGTKSARLWKAHKSLFPDSSLRKAELVAAGAMFVSFFVVASQFLTIAGQHTR